MGIVRGKGGIFKQSYFPQLDVDVLRGKKEIISVEERLAKQIIIPTSPGETALVVRNSADTDDRIILKEDGTVLVEKTVQVKEVI